MIIVKILWGCAIVLFATILIVASQEKLPDVLRNNRSSSWDYPINPVLW